MRENLSAQVLSFGKRLPNCKPGRFVEAGVYFPRMFSGMFGFKSYISRWLAPPCRNIKMTLICFLLVLEDSFARTFSNDKPKGEIAPIERPPTFKKFLREMVFVLMFISSQTGRYFVESSLLVGIRFYNSVTRV